MSLGDIGRIGALLLFLPVGIYHLRYSWNHRDTAAGQASRFLLFAALLIILSLAAALPRPTTVWLRWIVILTLHQSALCLLAALHTLLAQRRSNFFSRPIYMVATLVSLISCVLTYLHRNNLGSFIDSEPYQPTAIYYASYLVFYGLWLVLALKIVRVFRGCMRQNKRFIYRIRDYCTLGALISGVACAALAEMNLLIALFIGDEYREVFNLAYHNLKLPLALGLLISSFPTPLLEYLTQPTTAFMHWRQQRQSMLLKYLHTKMIAVVPRIHLINPVLHDARVGLEVSDARDLIWSHVPRTTPIAPADEARYLFDLLQKDQTIEQAGPYLPPPLALPLTQHNLAVAFQLLRLERAQQPPIPSLPKTWLLGNICAFRRDKLGLLREVYTICGPIGMLYVGPIPLVLLTSPESIASVLVQHNASVHKTPMLRRYLRPVVGDGLIVSEGLQHRQQRRILAPVFQPQAVANYAKTMVTISQDIQTTWQDGQSLDLGEAIRMLTLQIIGKVLFHSDLRHETNSIEHAITALSLAANEIANALVHVPITWPTPKNYQRRKALADLNRVVAGLITERRTAPTDYPDLLSALLRAQDDTTGTTLTDAQIQDEIRALIVAGHETTAQALVWTFYLLMTHTEIYRQVLAEVDTVLAGREANLTDLPQMLYTLRVVKEALRLYPAAWVILRQVQTPLTVHKYNLSKGMRVVISPYVLHRCPDSFTDPEVFNPDRWTPEFEAQLPRYAYLPFGAGPHICLGNHFAMMEMQLVLATLAQRVRFELVPGQEIVPEPLITLRPKGEVRVVVSRRG